MSGFPRIPMANSPPGAIPAAHKAQVSQLVGLNHTGGRQRWEAWPAEEETSRLVSVISVPGAGGATPPQQPAAPAHGPAVGRRPGPGGPPAVGALLELLLLAAPAGGGPLGLGAHT